jgi:hypothetical protein
MTRITDERLAEMVGAGVPCVPAQPGEIAAVVQELRAIRAAVSTPTQGQEGEAGELIAWLEERSKPDSGIRYGDNSSGVAEATFSGYDAAFVAEHFHGRGAARLACLLRTLSADNARLREEEARHHLSFDLRWKSDMRAIERWQKATGRTMTMPDHTDLSVWLFGQLEAAEARLSEAVEVLASALDETELREGRLRDASSPHWSVTARQFLDTQGGGNG